MSQKLPTPPNPNGWQCADCRHWLAHVAKTIRLNNQGNEIHPDAVEAMLLPERSKLFKVTVAPCTFGPNWVMNSDDFWCGQYSRRAATVRTLRDV